MTDRVPPAPAGGEHRLVSDAALLRWAPRLYLAVAVGLVPWVVYLAFTLPRHSTATHYRLAWVGFDGFLVVIIARTAWLGYRRRPEAELGAVVTATLLIVDAWFDITTSPTTGDLVQAVLLALFAELPAALATLYLVRRVDQVVTAQLRLAAGAGEGAPPGEEPDVVAVPDGAEGVRLEVPEEAPAGSAPPAPAGPVG